MLDFVAYSFSYIHPVSVHIQVYKAKKEMQFVVVKKKNETWKSKVIN